MSNADIGKGKRHSMLSVSDVDDPLLKEKIKKVKEAEALLKALTAGDTDLDVPDSPASPKSDHFNNGSGNKTGKSRVISGKIRLNTGNSPKGNRPKGVFSGLLSMGSNNRDNKKDEELNLDNVNALPEGTLSDLSSLTDSDDFEKTPSSKIKEKKDDGIRRTRKRRGKKKLEERKKEAPTAVVRQASLEIQIDQPTKHHPERISSRASLSDIAKNLAETETDVDDENKGSNDLTEVNGNDRHPSAVTKATDEVDEDDVSEADTDLVINGPLKKPLTAAEILMLNQNGSFITSKGKVRDAVPEKIKFNHGPAVQMNGDPSHSIDDISAEVGGNKEAGMFTTGKSARAKTRREREQRQSLDRSSINEADDMSKNISFIRQASVNSYNEAALQMNKKPIVINSEAANQAPKEDRIKDFSRQTLETYAPLFKSPADAEKLRNNYQKNVKHGKLYLRSFRKKILKPKSSKVENGLLDSKQALHPTLPVDYDSFKPETFVPLHVINNEYALNPFAGPVEPRAPAGTNLPSDVWSVDEEHSIPERLFPTPLIMRWIYILFCTTRDSVPVTTPKIEPVDKCIDQLQPSFWQKVGAYFHVLNKRLRRQKVEYPNEAEDWENFVGSKDLEANYYSSKVHDLYVNDGKGGHTLNLGIPELPNDNSANAKEIRKEVRDYENRNRLHVDVEKMEHIAYLQQKELRREIADYQDVLKTGFNYPTEPSEQGSLAVQMAKEKVLRDKLSQQQVRYFEAKMNLKKMIARQNKCDFAVSWGQLHLVHGEPDREKLVAKVEREVLWPKNKRRLYKYEPDVTGALEHKPIRNFSNKRRDRDPNPEDSDFSMWIWGKTVSNLLLKTHHIRRKRFRLQKKLRAHIRESNNKGSKRHEQLNIEQLQFHSRSKRAESVDRPQSKRRAKDDPIGSGLRALRKKRFARGADVCIIDECLINNDFHRKKTPAEVSDRRYRLSTFSSLDSHEIYADVKSSPGRRSVSRNSVSSSAPTRLFRPQDSAKRMRKSKTRLATTNNEKKELKLRSSSPDGSAEDNTRQRLASGSSTSEANPNNE